jgi:hypothetical protein
MFAILYRLARNPKHVARPRPMNILIVFAGLAVVLLAVDLLTAPKHDEATARPKLKESRRAA